MPVDCLLEDGFSGIACGVSNPGARTFVYFANESEIVSYTSGTPDGVYTAITFTGGAGLHRYEVAKDTLYALDSLQGGDVDLSSYNHEAGFNIKSMGAAARNAVQDLNGPQMIAIVPTKNGEFILLGKDNGLKILTNDGDTRSDNYGETVVLQSTENSEKRSFIFVTDEDATLAYLESLVVAS
jgi:hypothetical protein